MFRICSILVFTMAASLIFGGCAKKTITPVEATPAPQVAAPDSEPPAMKQAVETEQPDDALVAAGLFNADIEDLEIVYFNFDSHQLTPETMTALRLNAERLQENPDFKIIIEGHCDERGSDEYNLALGERRAVSVKEYLTSRGVSAERLAVLSFGEEHPATQGHDEMSWKKNRRVEFK